MRAKGLIILSVLLVISLYGCAVEQKTEEHISEARFLLDTICSITVFGTSDQSILDEAFDLCAEYEALLSISYDGSDIWRINHAGGSPVTVADQTLELIKLGVEYGGVSGGMFDITIGRLSTLWDFTGLSGVPSGPDLDFARSTVDYKQIIINGNTVRLINEEAWIDLGGVAKGYIAGKVADFLRDRGVAGAVVDFGGDIAIVGGKPDGEPWRVGIRKPFGERSELLGAVELGEATIVSSGVYERMFEDNGIFYHHILDPGTGMPVRSDVVSATVIIESAVLGDIMSTIALLVGCEQAEGLLKRAPGFIGALLVLDNGELVQYGDVTLIMLNA